MAAMEREGGNRCRFCFGTHRFGAEPDVDCKAGEGKERIQCVLGLGLNWTPRIHLPPGLLAAGVLSSGGPRVRALPKIRAMPGSCTRPLSHSEGLPPAAFLGPEGWTGMMSLESGELENSEFGDSSGLCLMSERQPWAALTDGPREQNMARGEIGKARAKWLVLVMATAGQEQSCYGRCARPGLSKGTD